MKYKLLSVWYKFNIWRCDAAVKFYGRLKVIVDRLAVRKPLITPTAHNILLKVLGAICIVDGIAIMIKGYADPAATGVTYICVGIICIIAKYTRQDTQDRVDALRAESEEPNHVH